MLYAIQTPSGVLRIGEHSLPDAPPVRQHASTARVSVQCRYCMYRQLCLFRRGKVATLNSNTLRAKMDRHSIVS